jgi:hypothetical protein
MLKELLKSRVAHYVGFGIWYGIFYRIIGFELTTILCLSTIIGEQVFLQKK